MTAGVWALVGRIFLEIAVGVALALLLRRFVFVLAYVKGNSMRDTLKNGEVLFALRRGLHRSLARFDVVLCRYPGRKGLFVKRVVGLPGERIAVHEGVLMIDGAPVEEGFDKRESKREMEERELGPGEYFLMGDNRPASRDSRSVGPIQDQEIIAVARRVVFPLGRIRRI